MWDNASKIWLNWAMMRKNGPEKFIDLWWSGGVVTLYHYAMDTFDCFHPCNDWRVRFHIAEAGGHTQQPDPYENAFWQSYLNWFDNLDHRAWVDEVNRI